MRLLSESEFQATFGTKMTRVPADGPPPLDFWPYFDAIPAVDYAGHDCSEGSVQWVYRDDAGRYEHVLVDSEHPDIFMVVVLDLLKGEMLGHHLLDLPKLYGITGPGTDP